MKVNNLCQNKQIFVKLSYFTTNMSNNLYNKNNKNYIKDKIKGRDQ